MSALEITAQRGMFHDYVLIHGIPGGPAWCRYFWKEAVLQFTREFIPTAHVEIESLTVSERQESQTA